MSRPRKVKTSMVPEAAVEGAGVGVRRSMATRTLRDLDPFLLFDHFGSDNPRGHTAFAYLSLLPESSGGGLALPARIL